MDLMSIAVTVLFVVVAALIVAIWAISRQVGILFERVSPLGALVTDAGPAVGDMAPGFTLPSLTSDEQVTIGGPAATSTLLFFLSPRVRRCAWCSPAMATPPSIAPSPCSTSCSASRTCSPRTWA
jgi:methylamine dehydrogenase accessory protein MauD